MPPGGVWRDRTSDYQRLRDAEHAGASPTELALLRPTEAAAAAPPPTPPWVGVVAQLQRAMAATEQKIGELRRMQARAQLPTVAGSDDETTEQVARHTAVVRRLLAGLSAGLRALRPTTPDAAAARTALTLRLQALIASFRGSQQEHMDELGARAAAEDTQLHATGLFTQAQTDTVETNDAIIREREAEIARLAHSIGDLAEMFRDLNGLVVDQGTLLDRIDYNVTMTAEHTGAAVRELEAADGHARAGRCRLLVIALVVIVLCVAAGLIVRLTVREG